MYYYIATAVMHVDDFTYSAQCLKIIRKISILSILTK